MRSISQEVAAIHIRKQIVLNQEARHLPAYSIAPISFINKHISNIGKSGGIR